MNPFPLFFFLSFHGVFPLKNPQPTPTSAVGQLLLMAATWTSSMRVITLNFFISRSHPSPQTTGTSTNRQFSSPPLLGNPEDTAASHPFRCCVCLAPACAGRKEQLGRPQSSQKGTLETAIWNAVFISVQLFRLVTAHSIFCWVSSSVTRSFNHYFLNAYHLVITELVTYYFASFGWLLQFRRVTFTSDILF